MPISLDFVGFREKRVSAKGLTKGTRWSLVLHMRMVRPPEKRIPGVLH
jgi:hypothetical protein